MTANHSQTPSPPSAGSGKALAVLQLLRVRQWIKNTFVFAPLLFTAEFKHWHSCLLSLEAFALFCLASSATYLVNDWRDVEQDRAHPIKCKTRPMARGAVSGRFAAIVLCALYALVLLGGWRMPGVLLTIVIYLVLNLAYSFGLKEQPVIDIFVIASGFVLRVFAGAMALSVSVSSWMFATTLCLALYLGAVKRRQELMFSSQSGRVVLRKYSLGLVDRYAQMSATCALVFYSLFVMSGHTSLIVTIPVVLFGLFRYWYIVDCQDAGESPTDTLLSDWQLLAAVFVWVVLCAARLWNQTVS